MFILKHIIPIFLWFFYVEFEYVSNLKNKGCQSIVRDLIFQ